MENKKTALVTGASSGIGKAVYKKLVREGWNVYGTSRKTEKGKVEQKDGGRMIFMEVTDEESVKLAVETIIKNEVRLDAVVNNAGYGIAGSVEDTAGKEASALFDANFFGALSVIRAALPYLRRAGGTVINISSVAGVLTIPFQSMYSASKAAMEAASEALRMEVKPYGVKVCLVEPGDTKTDFTGNRIFTEKSKNSMYKETMDKSVARMEHDEINGAPPEKVAAVVYKMINKKNPPVRRAVGFSYSLLLFLKRLLPDRLILRILGKMYA